MYQIGVARISDTESSRDTVADILGEMLGYLDFNHIKVGRTPEPREKMRRTRDLQRLAASVNKYYINDWIEAHDKILLLTLSDRMVTKVIGILAGYTVERAFVIDTIYVTEECRRLGAATTGLKTLISELSISGHGNLLVEEPVKWMLRQMPLDIAAFLGEVGFVSTDTKFGNCRWAYAVEEA